MSKPIHFSISGAGKQPVTDAPTVDDLLAQVGDYVGLLKNVEQAIAEDGATEIEWRVTNAEKHSPLAMEFTPFPRTYGMNIESRVSLVKKHTANGLARLRAGSERPEFFTDAALEKAEKIFARVCNGLDLTVIDFGEDDTPRIDIGRAEARVAVGHVIAARKPKDKPYRETGSIEAFLQGVEKDGFNRFITRAKLRTTGEEVKCIVTGEAQKEMESREIKDVWKNQRVRIYGVISYRGLGRISQIEADHVEFLRSRKELPTPSDIIDENFTGGLRSEDYLDRLRNGKLS